jgi:hypothetical protein
MKAAWLVRGLMPIALSLAFPAFAQTVAVSVPSTANPYLAGIVDGSTAHRPIQPLCNRPSRSPV